MARGQVRRKQRWHLRPAAPQTRSPERTTKGPRHGGRQSCRRAARGGAPSVTSGPRAKAWTAGRLPCPRGTQPLPSACFIGKRRSVTSRGASANRGVVAVLVGDRRELRPAALLAIPVDKAKHRGATEIARFEDPREPNPSAELRDVSVAHELKVRHRIGREALCHRVASSMRDVPAIASEDLERGGVRG